MTIGFDSTEALDAVWKLQDENKLKSILQDVLLNSQFLKQIGVMNMTLSVRMFQDEYISCKNELLTRSLSRLHIKQMRKLQMS